jgi:cobalamin biosynthesis protein CobT
MANMNEVENPLEPFKRATTATIRAIAGDDELEVSSDCRCPQWVPAVTK